MDAAVYSLSVGQKIGIVISFCLGLYIIWLLRYRK